MGNPIRTAQCAAAQVKASPEACPVTGRTAAACIDPTHAGCHAGHNASVALDKIVEAQHG